MRLFWTELKKIRRRHIGLLFVGAWLFTFVWVFWAMGQMDFEEIDKQGYYYLLLSFPLMNAIILPTILACVESRICDIELKGNTLKMLCTMQPRLSIFHIKLAVSMLYLLFFCLAETALIPLLCHYYQISQPIPVDHIVTFLFSTYAVSLVLIILQQSLSLLSDNQLFPLFFGVGGTFVGLFSWFFPNLPIRYILPWGYYCVGVSVNVFYDEATRTSTYYPLSFPTEIFCGFLIFGVLIYLVGRDRFMKKEV
ncbi:MAG: ABC transporter permease subunit [Lachnospiraceae bacterium]|nr:ABC transporter permease subunit [Lachnospiraceae bacterium]